MIGLGSIGITSKPEDEQPILLDADISLSEKSATYSGNYIENFPGTQRTGAWQNDLNLLTKRPHRARSTN